MQFPLSILSVIFHQCVKGRGRSTNVLREGGELGEGSTNVQRGEAGSTIERVGVTNV